MFCLTRVRSVRLIVVVLIVVYDLSVGGADGVLILGAAFNEIILL